MSAVESPPQGRMAGRLYLGTSGWSYPHWQGVVYPESLPQAERLAYYATRLPSVEINRSFYRLPTDAAIQRWRTQVPAPFVFSLKASAFITHRKKLLEPQRSLPPLLRCVEALQDQAGAVLFQLPPRWQRNTGRLEAFLRHLPAGLRCAFEFRDPSWFDASVYRLLERYAVALCQYHLEGFQSPDVPTADFGYYRWHGPGEAYRGSYGDEYLDACAERIGNRLRAGEDVFGYFNNDEAGHAFQDALRLWRRLSDRVDPYPGAAENARLDP